MLRSRVAAARTHPGVVHVETLEVLCLGGVEWSECPPRTRNASEMRRIESKINEVVRNMMSKLLNSVGVFQGYFGMGCDPKDRKKALWG